MHTTAFLDPHNPVTGSRTALGAGIYNNGLYKATNSGKHLTQGHLLNANLGGQAHESNLFPITADMNRAHSEEVEQSVKTKVLEVDNKRNQENAAIAGFVPTLHSPVAPVRNWDQRRVFYGVQVGGIPAPIEVGNIRNTIFRCTAFTTDNNNPNGNGGEASDTTLPHIQHDVSVPRDSNAGLAALGWAPDALPSIKLGPMIGLAGSGPGGSNSYQVHDAMNVVIGNAQINQHP